MSEAQADTLRDKLLKHLLAEDTFDEDTFWRDVLWDRDTAKIIGNQLSMHASIVDDAGAYSSVGTGECVKVVCKINGWDVKSAKVRSHVQPQMSLRDKNGYAIYNRNEEQLLDEEW